MKVCTLCKYSCMHNGTISKHFQLIQINEKIQENIIVNSLLMITSLGVAVSTMEVLVRILLPYW